MTTVCVFFVFAAGTWCEVGADPIGICHPVSNAIYCTAGFDDVQARASWYDPALGGINCFNDTCDHLGDLTPVRDAYGWAAACPLGMYGMTISFEHAGTWQCRDSGTAVIPKWGKWYTADGWQWAWVITIDFLLHEPEYWTYDLLDMQEVIR